jgi:hypothetical protein
MFHGQLCDRVVSGQVCVSHSNPVRLLGLTFGSASL